MATIAPAANLAVSARDNSFAEILTACPLCSGTSLRRLPTPGHWIGHDIFARGADFFGLQSCNRCSLAFVNPRPSPALLNAFYDRDDYTCHSPEAGSSPTARLLLRYVECFGPYESNQFLDFGCGGGFLLRAALDANWRAQGYDVGQRSLVACKAQGLAVSRSLDDFAPLSLDVIFLNHVFEHIRQPDAVLAACKRLLRSSGKIFVVVPNRAGMRARLSFPILSRRFNVDERHRAFPIHLFYFTPRTLSRTLEKHGFRVRAIETFGLGMDEFINKPDSAVSPVSCGERSSSRRKNGLRQIVKKRYFGAGLGENLMAIAEPA